MTILTIAAIEADPWNAVEYDLPRDADSALLRAANSAARTCMEHEYELMMAAREGLYTPPGWMLAEDAPDIHEYNEYRWLKALDRVETIESRLGEFGDPRRRSRSLGEHFAGVLNIAALGLQRFVDAGQEFRLR